MIQIWPKVISQWARHFANQMGIDSYVLFGSNTTHVWTGSPQVTLLLMARFEYDHKPDPPLSHHVIFAMKTIRAYVEEKKGQRSCFIAYHNIYMVERNMYTTRAGGSSVVRPKLSYVPRPTGLFLRLTWIFVLPNVNEVIWPVVQVLADHKGPFPRRG